MKLVINIPCLNEEKTLPLVLASIPKQISGIDEIEVQVVDDGSTDATAKVAEEHGAIVIQHLRRRGLGRAFKTGMFEALSRGCDIFVNTDGDNQYPSGQIEKLITPILTNSADIVIGNRKPWQVEHFSTSRKMLQYVGNAVTRRIASSEVPDTISGFRAYNVEAMARINVISDYSYTLDTLMQAQKKGLKITSIEIDTNKPTRNSRLFNNNFTHITNSARNILNAYSIYEPSKLFFSVSVLLAIPSILLILRFLYFFYITQGVAGHIQSLIGATIGMVLSGISFSLGVMANLIAVNRKLIEDWLYLAKRDISDKSKTRE